MLLKYHKKIMFSVICNDSTPLVLPEDARIVFPAITLDDKLCYYLSEWSSDAVRVFVDVALAVVGTTELRKCQVTLSNPAIVSAPQKVAIVLPEPMHELNSTQLVQTATVAPEPVHEFTPEQVVKLESVAPTWVEQKHFLKLCLTTQNDIMLCLCYRFFLSMCKNVDELDAQLTELFQMQYIEDHFVLLYKGVRKNSYAWKLVHGDKLKLFPRFFNFHKKDGDDVDTKRPKLDLCVYKVEEWTENLIDIYMQLAVYFVDYDQDDPKYRQYQAMFKYGHHDMTPEQELILSPLDWCGRRDFLKLAQYLENKVVHMLCVHYFFFLNKDINELAEALGVAEIWAEPKNRKQLFKKIFEVHPDLEAWVKNAST